VGSGMEHFTRNVVQGDLVVEEAGKDEPPQED
jgi:hypothetical protein